MPVQIVNSIETIQDTNQMMAEARDDYNPTTPKSCPEQRFGRTGGVVGREQNRERGRSGPGPTQPPLCHPP